MEDSSYIGGIVVGVGYVVAGSRLLRLSLRTRENPERLLAATFFTWGVSYACWQTPIVLADESLVRPLYTAGRFLTDLGTILSVFFLRLVFRPQSRLAASMVAGITIALILGFAGSGWLGDWEAMYPLENPWWWMEWGAVVVSVAWMGFEGFRHHGMAKLRRQHGLCDGLVCNRYLLWGLTGAVWTIYELAYAIQQIEFNATGSFSGRLDALAAALEFIPIVCIWLVFFPPSRYQRWIDCSDLQPKFAER